MGVDMYQLDVATHLDEQGVGESWIDRRWLRVRCGDGKGCGIQQLRSIALQSVRENEQR